MDVSIEFTFIYDSIVHVFTTTMYHNRGGYLRYVQQAEPPAPLESSSAINFYEQHLVYINSSKSKLL